VKYSLFVDINFNASRVLLCDQVIKRKQVVETKWKHDILGGVTHKLQVVEGLGDHFEASWPLLQCALRGIKRQA